MKNKLENYLESINIEEHNIELILDYVKENYNKKATKKDFAFADKLIGLFVELYPTYRNNDHYDIVFKGKDRLAVMQLLRVYKDKNPVNDSNKTIEDFKYFFEVCLGITDRYIYPNMTITYIANNLNKIKQTLNDGKNKRLSTESSLRGISEVLYEHFNKQ